MSGLRDRLQGEAADLSGRLSGGEFDEAARSGMRSRVRRGRTIRTVRTVSLGVAVVAVLGVGGWGLTRVPHDAPPAISPVPTATATPSPTLSASLTPSPTPSATPSATHDWSTVAASDLPPVFAGADPHQPESYEMADWVWDYVDDSWAVASYGSGTYPPAAGGPGVRVIYLIAPDNTVFHLLDFPQDLVSTSIAKDRLADIAAPPVGRFWPAVRSAEVRLCYYLGDLCAGARLDLTTGTLTTEYLGTAAEKILGPGRTELPTGSYDPGTPWNATFMERRANGVDAWVLSDFDGNQIGVCWVEEDATFRESSINAIVNAKPGVNGGPTWRGFLAPSRNWALFTYDVSADGGAAPVAAPELYLFDFAADTTRRLDPLLPAADHCAVTGIVDDTSGVVACGPAWSFTGRDSSKQTTYRFFFDGATAPVPYSAHVVDVEWLNRANVPDRVLPEPKNPSPDAVGWAR